MTSEAENVGVFLDGAASCGESDRSIAGMFAVEFVLLKGSAGILSRFLVLSDATFDEVLVGKGA